ncbi:MAG: LysM peptidoglycan-binding domain-containing protein [Candidatus Delongbacteria bacterium]
MWESRTGWTRAVTNLFAVSLLASTLFTASCTTLRPALQATASPELATPPDTLSSADQYYLLRSRFQQAEGLSQTGQDVAALDSLRDLMLDLRQPGVRMDSLRWALQLDVVRQMAALLEKTGPDPSEDEGYRSVDFQVQLLSDSLSAYASAPDSLLQAVLVPSAADQESDSLLAEVLQAPDSLALRRISMPDIPDCDRREVQQMVDYFVSGRGRRFYQIWLDRYPKVAPTIRQVLQEEGMPEDLIFLAMIESGFRISATSRAKAKGPWQFIPGTATLFDLRVDYWMDERLDLERATRAACRFLRRLYDRYDDWYMAMAAYNWGPGNIDRAIKRGADDYWSITRMPSETRNYVPTYLAARRVFQEAELHGFSLEQPVDLPELDVLEVAGCIHINRLAELFELNQESLRESNLHLVQGSTPPDGGHIYVPAESSQRCRDLLLELPESAFQDWVRHKVRKGETVTGIAQRYGVSASELRTVNKLSRRSKLKSGRVLLIPLSTQEREPREERAEAEPRKSTRKAGSKTQTRSDGLPVHKVRRGEVLDRIARTHGLSVAKLMDWNQLKRADRIYPGQELLLADPDSVEQVDERSTELADAGQENLSRRESARSAGRESASPPKASKGQKTRTHVVRAGDTAGAIAAKYGISVKQLVQANGLGRRAKIVTGQRLRIPGKAADTAGGQRQLVHVVKSGESLWALARQYKVKVTDLKRWNNLRGNEIHAGSRLVIILSEEG